MSVRVVTVRVVEVVAGVGLVPRSVGGKVRATVTFVEEVVTESVKFVVLDTIKVGV